jgi:hypothetical protein
MQRPPLPVDVTMTWWDYFVDSVEIYLGWRLLGRF